MKKLFLVLVLVLVLTLVGCQEEEQYYTQEEMDDVIEEIRNDYDEINVILEGNTLVEYKYNHYFDLFQIRIHEDETKENWLSIEIKQVDGVGQVYQIRHMHNSDVVEIYYNVNFKYPVNADYHSLTKYIFNQLQDKSYIGVLNGLS